MPVGSDIGSGRRAGAVTGFWQPDCGFPAASGVAAAGLVVLVGGGGGCCGLSAVWEVVAQAGAASACPAGDAGLVAGGEGPPGADLADVGGDQQQRGEQGAGGDAADAAAGGLGEGLVGGVFGVAVEALDGVAQGGVAPVPGRAGVGQVLPVACAHVGGDGDRGLPAELRWFLGWVEYFGPPVAW